MSCNGFRREDVESAKGLAKETGRVAGRVAGWLAGWLASERASGRTISHTQRLAKWFPFDALAEFEKFKFLTLFSLGSESISWLDCVLRSASRPAS